MNSHHISSISPTSVSFRFAKRFLLALSRIKRYKSSSTNLGSPRMAGLRYKKVKAAADKSLARAVGSRRIWSRAILQKMASQTRRRRRGSVIRRRVVISHRQLGVACHRNNRNAGFKGRRESKGGRHPLDSTRQTDVLRKLIPGGSSMDTCRLLSEVAHYMQCLKAQVQVMRRIADYHSSP